MSIGELPHLAWVDFDTLDFAIRSAHTYNLCIKCNAFQFVDDNTARVAGDFGQEYIAVLY